MRNIINLLYRYNAILVFVILEVFAFTLLITYNSYQRTSWFNSSNTAIAWLKDINHSITEPFSAMEENKQLRKENANLRNNELKNFYRSESGKVIINDSLFSQQYSYVPSQILDNSYNRQQNYILINVGTSKGIKPDMGVIGPDGIVGFVKDVSSNYALVIPILNRHFSTSVMLKRNNHFGLLEWEGNDPNTANIKGVINTVDIQEGDTIVTKSANGRFPEGITVGTVKSIEEVQGDPHFDVTINLSSDFKTLHTVYVIINHHKKEFNAIRNLIDDEE